MDGREWDVVVEIETYESNIQSGDVCVDEFHFLLFPVFILEVKS
jgi:hypothetical protein